MKKFIFVTLILAILCAFSVATVSAYAEETETPIAVTTETETTETDEINTLKEQLSKAIVKINELTGGDNYFVNKVLPFLLTGGIELIAVGLIFLRPYLKKSSLAKQLKAYAEQLSTQKDELTALLNDTDISKIKDSVTSVFNGELDKMFNEIEAKFGNYLKTFTSEKTTIETLYAQVKALSEAARQAWASKPEVVALLAQSPEKSTLELQVEENENLKNYIREQKGEEAEKIIKELEA